jgi:anthranilate synthase component 2
LHQTSANSDLNPNARSASGQLRQLHLNLQHYAVSLGAEVHVRRNDAIGVEEAGAYSHIILSPGPGLPAQAGVMCEVIRRWSEHIPMLGVCLGMQAIAEVFGGSLLNLGQPLHGVSTMCHALKEDVLFPPGIAPFRVGHYHSWVVEEKSLGNELEVLAKDEKGNIMAIGHKTYDVRGVQFHPESVLTENGKQIITNWIKH